MYTFAIFFKHFLGRSKLGLNDNVEYKVFDERDGSEIDDDECLIEYGKQGGTLVIGVQWEPIATTVPNLVTTVNAPAPATTVPVTAATTVSSTAATTAPVSVPLTVATTVATTIMSDTSFESWQDDDVFASTPVPFHHVDDDISLATTSAAFSEEQGINPTDDSGAGISSDITTAEEREPSSTLKRSFFEEILFTERKKTKSDGKHSAV